MRPTKPLTGSTQLLCVARQCVISALTLITSFGLAHVGAAGEIDISGTGTFKAPAPGQITNLANALPFSLADLASGTWSFLVRYEDRTPDSDPDPYVGRYPGAIRMFRLTVGSTTVELSADQAELGVSDGGLGFPNRESIRMEARAAGPYGIMHVSWIQLNQPPNRPDLRGVMGSLTSDALPAPAVIANLATSSPFDRFLLLRIDRPGSEQPLLYISSSKVSVLARPAPAQ